MDGLLGPFLLAETMQYRQDLHDLLSPAVEAVGYELLGVKMLKQDGQAVLRVYIDHADGIGVEDCVTASRQISAMLDVEDPIKEEYSLEVSSPGIQRPLFIAKHFQQACGKEAQINVRTPINGQKKFTGVIEAFDNDQVMLKCDATVVALPVADIVKAHLVVNF